MQLSFYIKYATRGFRSTPIYIYIYIYMYYGPASPRQCSPPPPMVWPPSHSSQARPLSRANSHKDGARLRHHPRNCRRNSRARTRNPRDPLPTQMRMMAMMPRTMTMTMMCFLRAGIRNVTVGSTTALMLFLPLGTKACLA